MDWSFLDQIPGAIRKGGDANLRGANLQPFRDDLFAVLSAAPAEVPALLAAVREGRIDGSCYEGECACLVGTIAKARGVDYESLGPLLRPNSGRPAEVWFTLLKPGDTTSEPVKLAEGWIADWLARMQAAFGPVAV